MFICVFCISWFVHLRVRPDRLWGGKDICASLSPYKCKELQPYTMFTLGHGVNMVHPTVQPEHRAPNSAIEYVCLIITVFIKPSPTLYAFLGGNVGALNQSKTQSLSRYRIQAWW